MSSDAKLPDLTPYAGRWVALAGNQVAGVGYTADEAQRLARRNRPKERLTLHFVPPETTPLALSPLLARLRPLLTGQEVYLVGGAVRDAVLGRPSHDLDFAVPQQAIKLAFQVANALDAAAYVLDRERDTGRVVLPAEGTTIDFARFRGPDLAADLHDRDFTINAMALPADAESGDQIIDPWGGLADLAARQIRQTHPAAIAADPVRALRAVRLGLQLDFSLPAETRMAITAAAPQLVTVSTERVRDELLKLLQVVPHEAVRQAADLGLLAVVLPEIAALDTVVQSPPHHEPVLAHTISVLRWLARLENALFGEEPTTDPVLLSAQAALADFVPHLSAHLSRSVEGGTDGRTLLYLAALFHDVGKAATQSVAEDGHIRFIGHEKVGTRLAGERLRRLALSNKAVAHVQQTVLGHMRPLWLLGTRHAAPTRRAVYRFFRDIQAAGLDVCLLSLADHLATYDGPGEPAQWASLVALVAALTRHYYERYTETVAPPLLLTGRDLMTELQLPPGPEIGRLLRLLEEAQAAGEITSREAALQFTRRQHKS